MFLNTGFGGICIEDSNKRLLRYKNQHITLELEGLKYTVSPMSFFQSNWRLNQALVKFIRDSLQKLNGKRVLDLYSGAGNFSLPAALDADEVIAVEENPYAVKDGRRNLKINGIKNCRFIHSSAETFQTNEKFNIFLLDPPRHGLTNKTINNILTMMPEQIVYVSCNPATLARDLKRLLGKYEIGSIRLVDFFPQTYHIESLVFLRLR
jgi:23S rRNA (uracil1939-C5)-methyltransferase